MVSENFECFSIREGINDDKKELQSKGINNKLRNSIWNVVFMCYLDTGKLPSSVSIQEEKSLKKFFEHILYNFFKVPGDNIINGYLSNAIEETRALFYDLKWNEVYDFIEFLASLPDDVICKNHENSFVELCNKVLKRENSAYKFVNNKITRID